MNTQAVLEAILFVAETPIPEQELVELLELPVAQVQEELAQLATRLEEPDRGLVLVKRAGGWRLYSKEQALPYLEKFATSQTSARLSNAALEVLAVVAYRQPVSRAQIAELRGVDSESALRTLTRRGLVQEGERLSVPGNPFMYRTTDLFLEMMDIGSLDELPPLAEHVPSVEAFEQIEEPSGQAR